MSIVNITNVVVLNNPAPFMSNFGFEITFECLSPLKEDLEFKLVYVGSAESTQYDQVLESLLVGPVPVGVNKFVLEAPPPNPAQIPPSDLLEVTVMLLTCSYRNNEFIRVGYYVNNEYTEEELKENPPSTPLFDKISRNILAEKPKVTRIAIEWDPKEENSVDRPDSGMGVGLAQEGTTETPAAVDAGASTMMDNASMEM